MHLIQVDPPKKRNSLSAKSEVICCLFIHLNRALHCRGGPVLSHQVQATQSISVSHSLIPPSKHIHTHTHIRDQRASEASARASIYIYIIRSIRERQTHTQHTSDRAWSHYKYIVGYIHTTQYTHQQPSRGGPARRARVRAPRGRCAWWAARALG